MTIQEIWERAKEKMSPRCKVCKVCNGISCRGEVPGVGAVGNGSSWTVCTEFLDSVKLNMDTCYENCGQDTTLAMFGQNFSYPIFIAPIGGMKKNYNGIMTDIEYMELTIEGANKAGILAFTGDGPAPGMFESSIDIIKRHKNRGVPVCKPWSNEKLQERLDSINTTKPTAFGMDIDMAGLKNMGSKVNTLSPKSVEDLRLLTNATKVPFILKGVMTAKGALKALEAGAHAIVVSSHGGRVMPSAPATCEVLPEIRAAVQDRLKIIVDGGIRTGADIFKALALGADAVMIGRPYVIAACGGQSEGVALYTEFLGEQLRNIMLMCGAANLKEITMEKIRMPLR